MFACCADSAQPCCADGVSQAGGHRPSGRRVWSTTTRTAAGAAGTRSATRSGCRRGGRASSGRRAAADHGCGHRAPCASFCAAPAASAGQRQPEAVYGDPGCRYEQQAVRPGSRGPRSPSATRGRPDSRPCARRAATHDPSAVHIEHDGEVQARQVRTRVKSHTHSSSGRDAVKRHFTRSAAGTRALEASAEIRSNTP